MKAWLKENHRLADDMSFEAYLHLAVEACGKGHLAVTHFKHAGITVD